jgi:hypothetical protein
VRTSSPFPGTWKSAASRATITRRLYTVARFYWYARTGTAPRIVRRIARRAGISTPVGPRTLRHVFIAAARDAGVPLRDAQEPASHVVLVIQVAHDQIGRTLRASVGSSAATLRTW